MRDKASFPKLKSNAVLSPMSGVTDVAFRALAARYGAGMTYTEFVNGTGLIHGSVPAQRMILTNPVESPVAVQLFGASVDDVVSAAKTVENRFDVIDVNCGCPAWHVIRNGSGSEMLKNPEKIAGFINKLASAVSKPVTVKIRIGIDDASINAVQVAKLVEDAGAAAIAVHGRTQKQGYSGVANWEVIKQVKEAVNIPVIGNGDVFSPEQFKQKLEQSNVDAIMIARGAIGNPFIFSQINDYLRTGAYESINRVELFSEYLELALKYGIPYPIIQRHAMSFTKTIHKGAVLRRQLMQCSSSEELSAVLA